MPYWPSFNVVTRVASDEKRSARSSSRAKIESLSGESPAPSAKFSTCSPFAGKVRHGKDSARKLAVAS